MTIKGPIKIEKVMALIVVLIFVLYSTYESYNLITGPKIKILNPKDGSSINTNWFYVEGTAKNISFISLNDRKIFIDNDGNFKEKLLLPYGYTIIRLEAEDRFGKKVEKTISLYRPKEDGSVYQEIKINHTNATTTKEN